MTLRELLARTSFRLKAEARTVDAEVTAIAYDSRQVKPGAVFVALRGVNADGARFVPQAIANGAIAVVAETAAAGRRRRALDPGAQRARGARGAGRGVLRQPERGAGARRHHRHERQDDHVLRARRRSSRRRASSAAASARSATASAAASSTPPRTTPEAPELQRMLRDMLDGRLRRLRDGGVVARAGAAARRQPAIRRRHLHQPDARSPRLPRRHGVVLRRQAPAVRDPAGRRRRRDQRRRSPRRRICVAAARRPVTYAIDAAADVRPGPLTFSLDGLVVRGAHAARHVPRALAAGRPSERLQHPRGRGRRDGARPAVLGHRGRRQQPRERPRPLPGRVGARRRRARHRRLRAHRRRAEEPARDGAPAGDRPAGHRVRLRRRSRSHEAAADGRGRRAAQRPRDRHLRQPAQRGPREDHRGDPPRHRHAGGSDRAEGAAEGTPSLAIVDRREAIEQGGPRGAGAAT